MATQNICFFNKHGFCKYLENCRNYHENKKCEKLNCEIRECQLRHPEICKFFRDYGFCKFSEWCRFSHEVVKDASENDSEVKKLEEKLNTVEIELKKNSEKLLRAVAAWLIGYHPGKGNFFRILSKFVPRLFHIVRPILAVIGVP